MGDWSNNLEYEHREYNGHFYDTDEDVHEEETEEMTTVEILKEMAFTATETQRRALEDAISALSENKGEWILADEQNKEDVENDNYRFICSECHCSDIHAKNTIVPYCWKCGAKMESEGKKW